MRLTVLHALLATVASILSGCADRQPQDRAASRTPAHSGVTGQPGEALTFKVGDARVLALLDARRPTPATIFQDLPDDQIAQLLSAGGEATRDEDGGPARSSPIWTFLVETGGRRILVDAGGAGTVPSAGSMFAALAASRIAPEFVDAVVVTHLHVDHVGGLVDAAGRARFPSATLYVDAADLDFWTSAANAAAASENEERSFKAVARALPAYAGRLRPLNGVVPIADGFTAEPLHGHTPGHRIYRLRSDGGEMIFVGDVIHSLAVQMAHPEVTVTYDRDAALARRSRLEFLERNVRETVLFAGAHFRPGIVSITRAGNHYTASPAVAAR